MPYKDKDRRREYHRAYMECYRQDKSIKLKESLLRKKYYAANRDRELNESKNWFVNHPGYKENYRKMHIRKTQVCFANKKAKKRTIYGVISEEEWRNLVEEFAFTCLWCNRREPDVLVVPDHIIPLAWGGKNIIENIQPLCKECNLSLIHI